MKKPEDAIDCFDKAIEIKKDGKEIWTAWFCKGVALKSLGYDTEAKAAFNEAKELRIGKSRVDRGRLSSLLHNLKVKLQNLIEGSWNMQFTR